MTTTEGQASGWKASCGPGLRGQGFKDDKEVKIKVNTHLAPPVVKYRTHMLVLWTLRLRGLSPPSLVQGSTLFPGASSFTLALSLTLK